MLPTHLEIRFQHSIEQCSVDCERICSDLRDGHYFDTSQVDRRLVFNGWVFLVEADVEDTVAGTRTLTGRYVNEDGATDVRLRLERK